MNTFLCLLAAAAAFDSHATSDLTIAVQQANSSAVTASLTQGADPNAASNGVTVLFTAATAGQTGIVESLIEAGADTEGASKAGTPMHAAAVLQDAMCLKALLNAGADLKATDAAGRTPLHAAVEKAAVECVGVLVEAGANVLAKDEQGVTALELAQQKKLPEIVTLLVVPTVDISKAVPVPVGADLADAVKKAADGQVLMLTAGTFSGPLEVRGKAVTLKGDVSGKTVISGGGQQAVIYVSDKGRLTLEGVQIGMGGKNEVGVFAKEAEVIIRHCAFDRAPKYACYADKASLHISDSRFTASADVSVAGLNGSTLDVRRSLFQAGADAAIIGQDSAAVAVHECRFDKCALAVSVRGGVARLRLNEFIGDAAAPSKKPAFVMENASSIVFVGNVVRHAVQGLVMRGRVTVPAAVTRNLIMNTELGVYAALEIEGSRPPLLFSRNTVCHATQGGLFLDKTSHARVANSIMLATGEGYALAMREAADLQVDGLAACASKSSLVFDNCKAPVVATLRQVCQTRESGEIDAAGVMYDEDTERMQQILVATDSGSRLIKAVTAVNTAAQDFEQDKPDAFAQAAAQLAAELDYARKRAAQMSAVTLQVTDRYDQAGAVAFSIYPATTNAKEPVANSLAGEAVYVPAGDYRLVATGLQGVEKRSLIPAGGKVAETVPSPGSLWLTFQGEENKPLQRLLIPLKSPQAMRSAVARIRHESLSTGVAAMPRPGVAKEEIERALSLARQHFAALSKQPEKAAGMSDDDYSHVMSRVRWVENAAARILNVAGAEADVDLILAATPAGFFYQKVRSIALIGAIEARLGVLNDGRLSKLARGADEEWARAAAIELHKQGVTSFDDVIVAALKNPKCDADSWATAFAMLDTPRLDVLEAMRGILARAVEKVAAGGDGKFATSNLSSAVYLYLLSYGNADDARRVAAVPLNRWIAANFSPLAADPVPLARYVVGLKNYDELREMTPYLRDLPIMPSQQEAVEAPGIGSSTSCVIMWGDWKLPIARPGDAAAAFENLVFDSAAANGDNSEGHSSLNRHKALISFCSPNSVAARFYGEGKMLLPETTWVPTILYAGKADEFLQSLVKGDLRDGYEMQIDYLSVEELAHAAGVAKAADTLPHFDVYLAAHRICTRGYYSTADDFHDGVERRPYTLRLKDGSGALSGVIEVRPWRVENKLRLALRIVQTPFYNAGDFISAALLKQGSYDDWRHHKFVVNGGASLIGSVQLKQGDTDLPLRACGRNEDGAFIYESTTSDSGLAGVVLHVNLAFTDQPTTLTYHLFSSDAALQLRRLDGRLPALEKAARWVDAGRVLQSMGRLSDAWDRYQRALTQNPARADLIDTAIEMFSQNGLHDRAAALLRDQTKVHPEDLSTWRDLAGELYLGGSYREAAEAAGHALSLNAADKPVALMRAMTLFLAGDRAAAATALDGIVAELPRVIPLRHLCQTDAPADKLQAYFNGLKDDERNVTGLLLGYGDPAGIAAAVKEPAMACKAWCFAGYHQLLGGKKDEARKAFTAALATGQERQLEFRMAQIELEQLK